MTLEVTPPRPVDRIDRLRTEDHQLGVLGNVACRPDRVFEFSAGHSPFSILWSTSSRCSAVSTAKKGELWRRR